ncbi:hypothetical protein C3486_32460 [Streptomyces sp. Ru73]|nr:hypothetical protein C3486_32460 [Streptomyces sp. Ru73]
MGAGGEGPPGLRVTGGRLSEGVGEGEGEGEGVREGEDAGVSVSEGEGAGVSDGKGAGQVGRGRGGRERTLGA